jgi:predicted DNA-binding transcriptional regulator YafY
MASGNHDTLVYRLAQILVKLNQGEKLDPYALANEFGVNLRTIQRDLNERFAYLPLQKSNGHYHLDPVFLGQLSTKDIERFASLAGVRGLFPSMGDDFLRDVFDGRLQSALLVKGHNYESLPGKGQQFIDIENAIIQRYQIAFNYQKLSGKKRCEAIQPYKLINNKGIWYLVAQDGNKLKTYSFSKIDQLKVLDVIFDRPADIDAKLAKEDGVWLSESPQEVVLKVHSNVAGYFKRRKLIANQVIEKELTDGGLLISATVGHPNQVLPIIRYWIPHIRIISPTTWQKELVEGLSDYLKHFTG